MSAASAGGGEAWRSGLATLAGVLAERGVSRLDLTPIEPDGTRGGSRALLPRHTDLPGVIGTELARGSMVDLRIQQMDVVVRVWREGGLLCVGCEPSDHPVAADLRSAGIG